MRKSRNGQRRAFAAFTKFSVLLMCFAVVFALVLTTGVLDDGIGYDANGNVNVADAAEITAGIMNETHFQSVSTLTVPAFNIEMHKQSPPSEYVFEMDMSGISFQNYMVAYSDAGLTNYVYGNNTKGNWNGSFGVYTSSKGTDVISAGANIAIPNSIQQLAGAGWKVDVSWTANVYIYDSGDQQFWMGIETGSSALTGKNIWDRSNSNDTATNWNKINVKGAGLWDDYKDNGNHVSGTTTIAGGESVLTLAIHRSRGSSVVTRNWGGCVKGIKIRFEVTKAGLVDNNAPRADLASAVDASYIGADNIGDFASGDITRDVEQIVGNPTISSNNHIDLTAGAARKGTFSVGEQPYAKMVQLSITEMTASNTDASVDQPTYYAGLAGITVGGNELSSTLYPTSAQGAVQNGAFSYGGGSDNGYFVWKVNDQGRASGT